jgi:hypothetical protein
VGYYARTTIRGLNRFQEQTDPMEDPELMARVRDLSSLRLHCFGHVQGVHGSVEKIAFYL